MGTVADYAAQRRLSLVTWKKVGLETSAAL